MSNFLSYPGSSEQMTGPTTSDYPAELPEPTYVDPAIWKLSRENLQALKETNRNDMLIDGWFAAVADNNAEQRRGLILTITNPATSEHPYQITGVTRLITRISELSKENSYFADKPEVAEEVAASIMYWQQKTGQAWNQPSMEGLYTYIHLAKTVLPYSSRQTGVAIAQSMPIIDPEVFWNMEDASGYGPAESVLYDEHVPYGYKRIILERWFGQIKAEYMGIAKPREDWEAAGKNIISFLQTRTYGVVSEADEKVYTLVVNFFEMELRHEGHYVQSYEVGKFVTHIRDRALTVRFLTHHIDENLSFEKAVKELRLSDEEKNDLLASISEQKTVFAKEQRQVAITNVKTESFSEPAPGKLRRAWRAFWKEIAGPPPEQR